MNYFVNYPTYSNKDWNHQIFIILMFDFEINFDFNLISFIRFNFVNLEFMD